ncbi:ABC transporter permease [Ornithinibacillus sp. 4-3]|uniref:ABC transporter permease n=1 Tax=Ornithinibacillus sp. 4-3 TaxID=3231488 RepID=A0AB39HT90_9BACI
MINKSFAGTKTLISLYLRRDRFLLPIWILLPLFMLIGHAFSFLSLTSNLEITSVITELNQDSLVSAVHGPIMSMDIVGATLWRAINPITLLLGVSVILTVIRHTRTDEENGRTELINSLVLGRYASLTAITCVVTLGVFLSNVFMSITMLVLGASIKQIIIFGVTLFFAGVFYTGIGLLACQLRNNSSAARNIGITILGLSLVINILNNFGGSNLFLKWFSPISWTRITSPFADENAFGLIPLFVIALLPIILAYFLSTKRDNGGAIFGVQAGPAEAAPSFKNPLTLSWRVHKGMFVGWIVAVTLHIGAFVAISPTISGQISSLFAEIGGDNWMEGIPIGLLFVSIGIYIMALFIGLYALLALNGLKKEELDGRNEIILDKKVNRKSYMFSFIFIALGGSAILLILMGVIGGIIYSSVAGSWGNEFWQILMMGISKIPAVWTLIGVFSLLYGFFPKITALSWGLWGLFGLLEVAWESGLVGWEIMQLSPFAFSHYTIQVENLSIVALSINLLFAVVCIYFGMLAYLRRDVMTKP